MATLKLYNEIVEDSTALYYEWFGEKSVTYSNVEDFIASIPSDDDTINIKIDCRGGRVDVGWKIYDALRQSGKKISAEVNGTCASMATIILLAAEQGKRTATEHSVFRVHEPYLSDVELCGKTTAADLQAIATEMAEEVERFANLYADRTTSSKNKMIDLMKKDITINADEAKKYGLIDDIKLPLSATIQNRVKPINKSNMNKKTTFFEAFFKRHSLKAMQLKTSDGEELTIDRESGEPQVGDIASPDGEHLMPNGETIVIVDGVITEIKPKIEEETTEEKTEETTEEQVAQLEKRIAELEVQLVAAQAKKVTAAQMAILNTVTIAGGAEWLNKMARSTNKVNETKNEVETNSIVDDEKARYMAYFTRQK